MKKEYPWVATTPEGVVRQLVANYPLHGHGEGRLACAF